VQVAVGLSVELMDGTAGAGKAATIAGGRAFLGLHMGAGGLLANSHASLGLAQAG
jgi:hypothetical protein